MKKYGIKVKLLEQEYYWVLDYSLDSTSIDDVSPYLFNTEEEAKEFVDRVGWTQYIIELYPYKEFPEC